MKTPHIIVTIAALIALSAGGCKKYLDAKPDKALVIPSSVSDLQALLDNATVINNADPGSGEASADNYYVTDADWATLNTEYLRRLYTWEKDNVIAPTGNDWFNSFRAIYSCNTVLENIDKVNGTGDRYSQNNVKGQALFVRGKAYFQSALIWCKAYNAGTAAQDLGLPLRLKTDFNTTYPRATNAQTFSRILADLTEAAALLPVTQVTPFRPSKAAAYGLLSRVHLYMGDYQQAGAYADSCLALKSELTDFNSLAATAAFPITRLGKEVIYESTMTQPQLINSTKGRIDSLLYRSYASNDLRKTIFFKDNRNGSYSFKGSYEGSGTYFSGISTNEIYLNRAECLARNGQWADGLKDLNALLIKRFKNNTFVPVIAANKEEALAKILTERRKELLMRGLRWMDIKRLNLEGANIVLSRKLNGGNQALLHNDNRYAIALPENLLQFGLEQNPR
jgi:hypothetical protein